jgi:hypothetical protein
LKGLRYGAACRFLFSGFWPEAWLIFCIRVKANALFTGSIAKVTCL